MRNKNKNSFFLFCFSLIPGAGEMYLGFMRQGCSLMGAFFAVIAFSTWLNWSPLLFLLPIIWFYSFFHSHNLYHTPDKEFYQMPDQFLFGLDTLDGLPGLVRKYHTWVAVLLILVGVSALWSSLLDALYYILPEGFYSFYYKTAGLLPRFLVAVLIILLGLHLIRGKKQTLYHDRLEEKDGNQNEGYPQDNATGEPPKETEKI